MDGIPSSIMLDILSRIPVKSLVHLRCVSKLWCENIDDFYLAVMHGQRFIEEPSLMMFYQNPPSPKQPNTLCFHTTDRQSGTTTTDHVFEPNKVPNYEFLCKKPLTKDSRTKVAIRGSYNGLICISEDDSYVVTTLAVIHPLTKQRYELPPVPLHVNTIMPRESCGLGFDSFTNTLKMVFVLFKKCVHPKDPDLVRENLCTMVHVFGTNSWQEIPQVPFYPIEGKSVFANGCLYWLASSFDRPTRRELIWFDIEKEEFGLVNPPLSVGNPLERNISCYHDSVVNLNGQVGYFCNSTMEVWILKKKEWVLHCRMDDLPSTWLYVLGCVNKEGDILSKVSKNFRDRFFVYCLKSGKLHEANVLGRGNRCEETSIIVYPNSLFSINTNPSLMKKALFEKKMLQTVRRWNQASAFC